MRRFGTISYNIYCNFTNYGSALQTWALHQAIRKTGNEPVLVNYCPDILADANPLNPYKRMWDQTDEQRKMIDLSMPAIRLNYRKFLDFYKKQFILTNKYTSATFKQIESDETIDGFVCGSDTIFCPDEFGFDDGYYAEYECMKGRSVSYAASFGDPYFSQAEYEMLRDRIHNFKALGIREEQMIPFIKAHTSVPVRRVIDPTLLLTADEYQPIIDSHNEQEHYLLLYSRRYSSRMERYAERIAREKNCKIIEISLRAVNAERGHKMAYEAGVEEFLALVKNAEYVVTNSYHGMIFSIQFRRPFVVFSREQCDNKITELLDLLGLRDRLLVTGEEAVPETDFDQVHQRIKEEREGSISFLKMELELLRG